MIKFIIKFVIAGFVVPITLSLIWMLLERYKQAYISIGNILENVQLLLWPSSIFMMATAAHEEIDYEMLAISIMANILFYAVIGFLVWWGLHKQRWFLYLAIGLVLSIWYKLLTL